MKNLLIEVLGDNFGKITQIRNGGKTWYKALDLCKVLGIKNTSLAVKGNLRIGYFGIEQEDILSVGPLKTSPLYISEAGMFKLILKSRKPAAYMIKVKLSLEVLPAIMRDGSFVDGQADNYQTEEISLIEVKQPKHSRKAKV
jgi:prophage antirepressor-like protein